MLSDEEKKAIEYLKRHIIPYYEKKGTIEFMLNDTILNLIEKQKKYIEILEQNYSVAIEQNKTYKANIYNLKEQNQLQRRQLKDGGEYDG